MDHTESIVIGGIYKHYKGQNYKILSIARLTETLENVVVYQALYGEAGIWVRPLDMFLETVMINGNNLPRFELQ